jgi:hypothetical protein
MRDVGFSSEAILMDERRSSLNRSILGLIFIRRKGYGAQKEGGTLESMMMKMMHRVRPLTC